MPRYREKLLERKIVFRLNPIAQLLLMAHDNAIRGVPIFSEGTHNGRTFTEQDIDDMIESFKELDYRPALKLGHAKPKRGQPEVGMPAYGWVTNLTKRVVDGVATLFADFESMHDSVINAIRLRMYDRVSAEIYLNLERGKKLYRRALKAVALLGADVPAVANLTPLHKIEFADEEALVFADAEAELEVEDADLLAAMESRVEALDNFLQENQMKLKSKELTRLRLQMAEFMGRMKHLKKAGKKDDDEELKNLQTEIDQLADKIAGMDADEETPREKQLRERLESLEIERRQGQVEKRVARCKVKSLAGELAALFNYALQSTEVVEMTVTDDKGKEQVEKKPLVFAVESLVDKINKKVEPLFKQLSISEDPNQIQRTEDEDVGVELDEAIQALMDKEPKTWDSYSKAQAHILKTNADLRKRYNEFMTQGNVAKASRRLN